MFLRSILDRNFTKNIFMDNKLKGFYIKSILILLLSAPYQFVGAQTISLEDIWTTGKYRAEYYASFNWTKDGQHYTELEFDNKKIPQVNLYHIKNGLIKNLASSLEKIMPENVPFDDYLLSPDQNLLLFTSDEEPIYRRSSRANYYLLDNQTQKISLLNDTSKGKISYPTFSPDGKKIAYVRENNLFSLEISSRKETAITQNGKFNYVINGACDWVYEEEFEFAQAFFWSPDSKKIAFYQFDETNVKEYNMQVWGANYPIDYKYKYPKVGEENSLVKILCYFFDSPKTIEIDATVPGDKEYFPRMRWTGNTSVLSYYRMNRLQNNLEIIHYDVVSKSAKTVYTETDKAYIEINDSHFYFSTTEDFVFTSEKSGFRHIYLFTKANNIITPLTSGEYEVTEIIGIDEKNKIVYFISQEDSPLEKQLYSVDFTSTKKRKLTKEKGVHDISFSPGFDYYTDGYSNANTPITAIVKDAHSGNKITVLTENTTLKKKLEKENLSQLEFFKFTTTQGVNLNAWMMKTKDFDEKKKYPVLLTIYGGPGSQEVMNSWKGANYFWFQLLSQKGYIIACVDGRGTGGRGAAFKKTTQLNLGKYETEDLIETAKQLKSLSFIDPSRIGIFGWSFGGYLSSLAITKGADHFKTAIAVAPVTNWRYYDNIYTERYMGLPSENGKGYDENAPAYFAKELKGNYLLIHGTADDNVHLQNSIEMQRALIKANKQFDLFYYPDKNHGIYGGNTRYHLYKMMTDFILEKL